MEYNTLAEIYADIIECLICPVTGFKRYQERRYDRKFSSEEMEKRRRHNREYYAVNRDSICKKQQKRRQGVALT